MKKHSDIFTFIGFWKTIQNTPDLKPEMSFQEISNLTGIDASKLPSFFKWIDRINVLLDKKMSIKEKSNKLKCTQEELEKEKRIYFISNLIYFKKLPRYIYKYKPIEKIIDEKIILCNHFKDLIQLQNIYLSDIKKLNDPFECSNPTIKNITKKNIEEFLQYLSKNEYLHNQLNYNNNELLSLFVDQVHSTINSRRDDYKVGSFSSSSNNILLWAHYADSSKGVCIEFDILEALDFFDYIIPVTYLDKKPEIDLAKDPSIFPSEQVFFTKHSDWKYENELRLVKLSKSNIFKFNMEAIKSITFGCRSDNNLIAETTRLIDSHLPKIKIYKASISETKYAYDIKAL
jgi:hypothetical protein